MLGLSVTLLAKAVAGAVAGSGPAVPVLNASATSGAAPFGVVFNAVGTTHPLTTNPFRDLLYFFDAGDGSVTVYTHGELAGLLKRRYVGGPVWTYVFETPGTHTTRVWAYDGVTLSLPFSQSITVTDPDVVYSQANTYYVHPTVLPVPGVDGVPADAAAGNCILSSDFQFVTNLYFTSNKRVRFRSGQTWTAASSSNRSACVNLYVDTYGGSAQATINAGANNVTMLSGLAGSGNVANNPNNWRVVNLKFDSNGFTGTFTIDFKPITTGSGDANIKNIQSGYSTFHNCSVVNAFKGFQIKGIGSVLSNYSATNINGGVGLGGGIGAYFEGVLKNGIVDSFIDAAYGGEHCLRVQGFDYFAEISNTYKRPAAGKNYSTLRGWQVASQPNAVTAQYAVRGYGKFDADGIVADTISAYLHTGQTNLSANEPIADIMIEGNFLYKVANLGGGKAIESSCRRATLRGNVVYHSNNISASSPIQFGNPNAAMTFTHGDHLAVGNTIYSDTTKGFTAFEVQGGITDSRFRGNLVYVPNSTKDVDVAGTGPTFVYGAGVNNSGNTYDYNSSPAQIKSTDPLFVGPLTSKPGFKLQAGSPYVGFVTADLWHFMDGAGFLLGDVPHDAGALNNVNKQVDAWTLVP